MHGVAIDDKDAADQGELSEEDRQLAGGELKSFLSVFFTPGRNKHLLLHQWNMYVLFHVLSSLRLSVRRSGWKKRAENSQILILVSSLHSRRLYQEANRRPLLRCMQRSLLVSLLRPQRHHKLG